MFHAQKKKLTYSNSNISQLFIYHINNVCLILQQLNAKMFAKEKEEINYVYFY